jgi:hypothetical protein
MQQALFPIRISVTDTESDADKNFLVYDGDCPFCSSYVKLVRLRDSVGAVELVSARQNHPAVEGLRRDGYDLDEGMALILGKQVYFGDECVVQLALLSSPAGIFNRVNAAVFRSPRASALLYPIMRSSRRLYLVLAGHAAISR